MTKDRKDLIIESALKRFAHYGYQKTSMNEIATDLRISKANLNYYYPDKPSLLKDCFREILNDINTELNKVVEAYDGDLISSFDELFATFSKYGKEYYLLDTFENFEWLKDPEIEKVLKNMDELTAKVIKVLIQKSIDNNEIHVEHIESECLTLFEILKGLSTLYKMGDIITGIPDITNLDKVVESQKRAVRFILKGKLINNK